MACLDIWKNEGVEIIANDRRTRSTSSYVTFTDIERLIEDVAENPTTQNLDAKRLIDRKCCLSDRAGRCEIMVLQGAF